jgi:hypothetical protein
LDKVTAVEVDPALWAIHTLAGVIFGCNQQLISKADELATIHNRLQSKEEGAFDVIFLPEVNYDSIPDIGPITIGNSVTTMHDYNFYCLAFLYNLLNDSGRMLVRFSGYAEEALRRDPFDKGGDHYGFRRMDFYRLYPIYNREYVRPKLAGTPR